MLEAVSAITSSVDRAGALSNVRSVHTEKLNSISTAQHVDFGDIMVQVAANAAQTLRAGEAAAIAGIQGKASVQQVVEAVMSAEQALQTAIAIRDKVVAAYQEISRMAI
ncbi:flagellar hook-basal body complex protein FliE [Microvirga thermotolerans]|uniref:Flagellar hook-basal body complex protein FliE n=1 Tax=Microvirga thermotolerans TaxID=2651334 RepID=A0A5P9K024_9HYPH|nr:flagellar hook-basal body complex protein FliE [Microvirga thermotolerans]QFU18197.1 flagellar hook-basal body complex protein FliE [Microvirga thermotolerans]